MSYYKMNTNSSKIKKIFKEKRFIPLRKRRIRKVIDRMIKKKIAYYAKIHALYHSPTSAASNLVKSTLTATNTNQNTRIMSFNILAPIYVQQFWYKKCIPADLDWRNRQNLIFEKFRDYQPSIACLQEFESESSKELSEQLRRLNYDSVYNKKTGDKTEGESTFWKKDEYECLHKFNLELNKLREIKGLESLIEDSITQILVLKHKGKQQTLIVANTHFVYQPRKGQIKLAHAVLSMKALESVREFCIEKGLPNINSIFCGDFNSIPNSGIYKLLNSGVYEPNGVPLIQMSNQIYATILTGQGNQLQHFKETTKNYSATVAKGDYSAISPHQFQALVRLQISLDSNSSALLITTKLPDQREKLHSFESSSAYLYRHLHQDDPKNGNYISTMINKVKSTYNMKEEELTFEPNISHISEGFLATVDYVWFDRRNSLKPTSLIEPIDLFKLNNYKGFPNHDCPSDHLPLIIDFSE